MGVVAQFDRYYKHYDTVTNVLKISMQQDTMWGRTPKTKSQSEIVNDIEDLDQADLSSGRFQNDALSKGRSLGLNGEQSKEYAAKEQGRYEALKYIRKRGNEKSVNDMMKNAKQTYENAYAASKFEKDANGRSVSESERNKIADDAANKVIDEYIQKQLPSE